MNIDKGKKINPVTLLFHGEPGSGKSLFAHKFDEKALFIGNETPFHYDCDRVVTSNWNTFLETLAELKQGKHPEYKTIVIDTLDGMQDILENHLLSLQILH